MSVLKYASLWFVLFLLSCGSDSDPQELVKSLRTIGVGLNPVVVATPSADGSALQSEVSLYFLTPLDATTQLAFYKDPQTNEVLSIAESQVTIDDPSTFTVTNFDSFKLVQAKAHITTPSVTLSKLVQMKYGFQITSAGRVEHVVGYLPLVVAGSTEASWTTPAVSISSHQDGGTLSGSEASISVTYTNPNNEPLKIGWFVTSGELKNRRAKSTTWSKISKGKQLLVVTVRGTKSRAFAFQAISLTAE